MLELALFAKPPGAWLIEKFGSEVISRWTTGQRCSRSTSWCGSGWLRNLRMPRSLRPWGTPLGPIKTAG